MTKNRRRKTKKEIKQEEFKNAMMIMSGFIGTIFGLLLFCILKLNGVI